MLKNISIRALLKTSYFVSQQGEKNLNTGLHDVINEDFEVFETKPSGKEQVLEAAFSNFQV